MRLKNTFVKGRMNKDLDERLLPKGEYPNAENIRLANSEASDVGAIENVLGNKSLTSMGLTNAVSIGSFSDDSNQKVYWFVTADEKDVLMEYDFTQPVGSELSTVLESSTVLNFSKDHLITGVVKVINGEHDKDLLVWTDDLNQPRCVNIARFKANFALPSPEALEEEDILLIKKPPMAAPAVTLVKDDTVGFDDDIFLSIAYRYVYEDRERSALSSFSNYSYNPGIFNLDYQAMENAGMVNRYNNLEIEVNTGSKRVKEIEVISKQPNSNKLSLIRSFDKSVEGWGVDETQTFTFKSDSVYMSLPQDELFRAYDNVPLKAKALEMIGTRLVFGNYVEGYDMVDSGGDPVNLDEIEVSINTSEVEKTSLITGPSGFVDRLSLSITEDDLDISRNIRFTLNLKYDLPYPNTTNTYNYDTVVEILYNVPEHVPVDSNGVIDLSTEETFEEMFRDKLARTVKARIMDDISFWPGTYVLVLEHILTTGSINANGTFFTPKYNFTIYDDDSLTTQPTTEPTGVVFVEFSSTIPSEVYVIRDSKESLKSNRNYELGLVYLDEFNRASTVQTWLNNTINVPHNRAPEANNLRLTIPSTINAPTWADRFKVVVRQNRGDYHTVYSSFSFKDETDAWILLDGDNKNKVSEGDEIIPKILQGDFIDAYRRVKVLEVVAKEQNFVENNFLSNEANSELKEPAGTYMRIKSSALPELSKESEVYFDEQDANSPSRNYYPEAFIDLFSTTSEDEATITPLSLTEGSKIKISLNSSFNFNAGWKNYTFEEEYTVIGGYSDFKAWFEDNITSMFFRDSFDEATENYLEDSNNPSTLWPGGTTPPKVSVMTGAEIRAVYPLSATGSVGFLQHVEDNSKLYLRVEGFESGSSAQTIGTGGLTSLFTNFSTGRRGYVTGSVEVTKSGGDMVFETLPVEVDTEIFYETEQTFDISNGLHPTSIDLKYHNCYTFRNGVESYRYKDGFNTNSLNIDLRPTSTSIEKYKEVRRFADLTYSEPYNENSNLNGLNEFNLGKANFKEDVDKKYGYIQHLYSRDTDLLLFQEDKVSKVLYGKNLLSGADGSESLTAVEDVLGQQIAFMGEYGISRNPESFAFNGFGIYFTDAKRGAVMKLTNNGLEEISANGMRGYFRDSFKKNIDGVKLGEFDPYQDQYVLSVKDPSGDYTITYDEKVKGFTSFHSFDPQYMIGMNGNFFTFNDGELYIHHSEEGTRNQYYDGGIAESKLSLMVNDEPSEVKILKAISFEGSSPWDVDINAFVASSDNPVNSQLSGSDFKQKEGLWYSHVRRSNKGLQTNSKAMYGIGVVTSLTASEVVIGGIVDQISYGDIVYNTNTSSDIGEIQSKVVDNTNNTLTLTLNTTTGISVGDFIVGRRDSVIEGETLRGYVLKLDLSVTASSRVELYAVNTEVVKSYA